MRSLSGDDATEATTKEAIMLWTIFIVLLVLWALGFVSGYAIGGFIHLLLVIAVVVLLIQLIQGRSSI
jgi:fatty acid desaturase